MENVTIGQIVAGIGSITAIITFVALIYNLVKKTTFDRIDKNEKNISDIQIEMGLLKRDITDGKEERLILVNGVLACLKGLKEQGANGPVTEGIKQIEDYLIKKSHN